MRTRLLTASTLCLTLVSARASGAQTTTIDEGSFTITRAGRTGREDFRIVRVASPSLTLVGTGTSVSGTSRVVAVLRTDTSGAPLDFQLDSRESNELRERITIQATRDRLTARSQSPRGESAREYFLHPGMAILDDEFAHQYFFLTLQGRDAVATVLPRRNELTQLHVISKGDDAIEIAGTRVTAHHYVVSDAMSERQLWTDSAGRVLRVEVPALALTAVRDAMPSDR
ncbi:MAG: DUF6134 family protein [Gemmatimonadaceae bacterium]